MAKPENIKRFFYYLSLLRQGLPLSHILVSRGAQVLGQDLSPVRLRQFFDDIAYLRELLPLWEPGSTLEAAGLGTYRLVRTSAGKRLSESEFLPFLDALSRTTNLFPYPVEGWLGTLSRHYGHGALKLLEGRILYTSTPHPDRLKTEHFHALVESLVKKQRVDLTYKNREGVERSVDFELLAFLNHNGVWYVVGDGVFGHRPVESSQPTQLKLSRLRLCRPTLRPYRNRFGLESVTSRMLETFGSHFILADGRAPISVTMRFYGEAVAFVKESWFHRGQMLTDNEDGTCDLVLRVNDLFDGLQLAGQWGSLVRPLDPPEFVERWRERAVALAQWAGQRR